MLLYGSRGGRQDNGGYCGFNWRMGPYYFCRRIFRCRPRIRVTDLEPELPPLEPPVVALVLGPSFFLFC